MKTSIQNTTVANRTRHGVLSPSRTTLTAVALLACSTSNQAVETASEGESGLAVGLHATLVSADKEVVSNEFEVLLVDGTVANGEVGAASFPQARARITSVNTEVELPSKTDSTSSLLQHQSSVALAPYATDSGNDSCNLQPDSLPTLDGRVCWLAITGTSGALTLERSITRVVYPTPDGLYHAVIDGTATTTSLDWVSAGYSVGVGCAVSPTGDRMDVDYLESLLSIGLSSTMAIYTVGVTTFYVDGYGLQRAVQYDSGISASVPVIPFLPFSVSLQTQSSFLVPPTRIDTGSCEARAPLVAKRSVFADTTGNPFERIAQGLTELSQVEQPDYTNRMLAETARSALPVFDLLATKSGTQPTDEEPAKTHADLSDDFFSRNGTKLCPDCKATSIDSFLYHLSTDTAAAEGDAATKAAVTNAFRQYQSSTPDAIRLAVSQRSAGAAVRFAGLAHQELAAQLRGDAHRYVSSEIVDVQTAVGEPVAIRISAQEIADLVGVDAEAIEGAHVTIDGSPWIERSAFELREGAVDLEVTTRSTDPLLLLVEVDLSSAVGPFSEPNTEEWVVRPAMRRVLSRSGAPASLHLAGPRRSAVGSTATLTAFVTDEHFAPVSTDALVRFYDGANRLLGEAPVRDGTASLSTSLTASTPVVEKVEPATLTRGDGDKLPGYTVSGTGFSRDALLYLDEVMIEQSDMAIVDSTTVVFSEERQELAEGPHHLVVENPDGHIGSLQFVVGTK